MSAVALSAGVVAATTGPAPHFNRTIYVVNQSSVVSDAELANDLPAFQAGVEDYERYWSGSIKLVIADAVPYRAWGLYVQDDADVPGVLGYHDVAGGVPSGRVFAKTGKDYGANWTVTFTHELFEMSADPFLRRADNVSGKFYLVEVGDPVEDDSFAYQRPAADGTPVAISDFVTDQWYRKGLSGGKYDFANHVSRSLQLLSGGYVSWWGYNGWTQDFARGQRHVRRAGVLLLSAASRLANSRSH